MQNRVVSAWAGSISITWMLVGYVLLRFVVGPHQLNFGPWWLFALTVFLTWLGVGFVFALAGIMSSSLPGRISAVLALGLFVFFCWLMFSPMFRSARTRAFGPNPAASGNGAVTSVFHAGRPPRAVPEPQCWQ
jgi:hypothetical protein